MKTYELGSQTFRVEIDPQYDVVFFIHPKWSLMGRGKTLEEAEKDLLLEIKDIYIYITF